MLRRMDVKISTRLSFLTTLKLTFHFKNNFNYHCALPSTLDIVPSAYPPIIFFHTHLLPLPPAQKKQVVVSLF